MFSSCFLSLSSGKCYSNTVTLMYYENMVLTPFGVEKHKFYTCHLLSFCFLYNVLIFQPDLKKMISAVGWYKFDIVPPSKVIFTGLYGIK